MHARTGKEHTTSVLTHRGSRAHEHPCVLTRVSHNTNRCVVARMFRCDRKPVFDPPGDRMKPEQTTVETCENTNQRIPPPNVSRLVCHHGAQVFVRPCSPLSRKYYFRPKHTRGQRSRNTVRLVDGNVPKGVLIVDDAASSHNLRHRAPAKSEACQ